jgi:hypothetical protein
VDSIPANSNAQNVPSFRRWRLGFEMKLSPFGCQWLTLSVRSLQIKDFVCCCCYKFLSTVFVFVPHLKVRPCQPPNIIDDIYDDDDDADNDDDEHILK